MPQGSFTLTRIFARLLIGGVIFACVFTLTRTRTLAVIVRIFTVVRAVKSSRELFANKCNTGTVRMKSLDGATGQLGYDSVTL